MERKTLDRLLAAGGLVVATLLVLGGALLTWAHNFVGNEVHSQLAAQQIYFPPKGSEALADPQIKPYLDQYAGQQLTTGAQAKAYADHFIAVHVAKATGGLSYAQISAKAKASPDDQTLAGLKTTAFQGETLRGLLLNAYAFGTMGTIAGIAAVVAFVGAAVMAVLAALGFVHAKRVDDKPAPPSAPVQELINA